MNRLGWADELAGSPEGSPSPSRSVSVSEKASAKPSKAAKSHKPTTKPSTKRTAPQRVATNGPRKYTPAQLWGAPKGKRGALITYTVRVQHGLPYDAKQTARFIHGVLNDKRSWGRSGQWRLKLVPTTADSDVDIYLVTRTTTDRLCAPLQTRRKVSCFNNGRVVLNADRWAYGAKSYGKDLIGYRRNLVNHEFGHSLGHGHVSCPGKGKRAPIMMQQTKGLDGCRRNPWPNPKG
ncbi:DUF3152 domain-containing protein [Microlunatus soli]|uniref:DUF3152 domain-containing protein n=1 Tax=Microlunatus soli TaxID=630515 RepID=UPI001E4D78A9|nr:DUF3152 domain-containing protein [Microlunatus soli]